MEKINLLVLDVSNAGVGKFRFSDPHIMLQKLFPKEFHVDIMSNPPLDDKNFQSRYDAVFIQGSLLLKDELFKLFEQLKKNGMKIILDLDDYWRLPRTHAMFRKMESSWKTLVSRLKLADLITTTTKYLAKEIKKYNKNVAIIPNAINPNDKQFQPNTIESDRIRVGWVGGSSHLEDLKEVRGMANHMIHFKEKPVQMVMCGFNNQTRDINTGKITTTKFPKVWMQMETVFTANYSLSEDYRHYLLHPKKEQYFDVDNQPYKRIWTKPITSYGTCYNEIDIALAPLVNNTFNQMKSQLKVIEAGFHKKALIVSDIAPYQIDCVHGENAMIVKDKKKHKLWPKFAKQLVRDENMRKELGEALYETVKDKYNLENVTKTRASYYKNLF